MDQEYKEIELMDYVRVILKRKWSILTVFLGVAIFAGIFSFILPKIYEIDTSLEIGQIAGAVVESPTQVVEKIDAGIYGILIREKLQIPEEKYPKIKAENPKGTNLVTIQIESSEIQKAKSILEEINNLVFAEHQEKLEKKKTDIEENIKEIQEELTLLETKKEYSEGIAELQITLSNLKERLNNIEETKIVKTPTISEKPVKPKPVLNIVIAGILGIFVGVFFAFGKEWWDKSKA